MLTLFWWPKTRAFRALWMLEELGISYEVKAIDIRDEAAKADPDFRAASPMGKVPAIADGSVQISDSAAICLYLADRYQKAKLAPAIDHPMRGLYCYWIMFSPGVMEPAMAEKMAGWEPNPGPRGWGDFDSMINVLEQGLRAHAPEGPWLLGEHFSAADLMVGSTANFMKQFGILPDSRLIEDYIHRCCSRPAFKKAQAREQQGA